MGSLSGWRHCSSSIYRLLMKIKLYIDFRQALTYHDPYIVPMQEAKYRATGDVEPTRMCAPSATATTEVDQPWHLVYPVENPLRFYIQRRETPVQGRRIWQLRLRVNFRSLPNQWE